MAVLLPTPWRGDEKDKDPWGEEVYNALREEVQTHKLCKDAGIEYINILLVGEISAGKSSFFNSLNSVYAGHVTTIANSGFGEESLTTQYRQYKIKAKDKKKKPIKFKFCDTMGLEGEGGLSTDEVGKILDGNVENLAELKNGIHFKMTGYNKSPTENDRIHCVAFVVSAATVSAMDTLLIAKIKGIRKEANRRELIPIIILTRIDQICDFTLENTSSVFKSKDVKEKVQEVSHMFGINQAQIYPVRNYSEQTDCKRAMDILILRVARQIVRNSSDYLADKLDREAEDLKNAKKKLAGMKINEKKKKAKKEKAKKGGNTSDEDSGSPEEEDRSSEEDEETQSDSDSSVKQGKSKKNQPRRAPSGDYSDSDYGPKRGKNKPSACKRSLTLPKNKKGPPPKPITTPLKATKKPPRRSADQRKGIVQEDFDGDQGDGEIEVKEGQEVTEITPDKDGWTVVKANGDKGKVPTDFIEWTPKKGPKQAPARSKKMKKMCAVEDYNAQDDNEVDLYEGEEVTELQPDVEGWTMIRNENGEEGIVPTDYLGISE